MSYWKRSNRRLFRKNRYNNRFIRYLLISLIAVMFIMVIVLFAVANNKPDKSGVSSTTVTTTTNTTTTITTTTTTATTTDTTVVDNSAKLIKPVGDEYFDDACFIGDSRTQGLKLYSAPKNATFYAEKGMTVAGFFNKKAFNNKTMTAEQALKKNKNKFGKVYIMLGLNELAWPSVDTFIQRYGDVVDSVKSSQPGAKVFVQSILPVSAKKSASHQSFNNPRIKKYNELTYQMCRKKKVIYLNVAEAVQDKDGNLPAEATTDGIHMNKEYCDKWMYYIRTHTIRTHTDVPIAGVTTTTKTAGTSVGPASTSDASAAQTSIVANTTATTVQ